MRMHFNRLRCVLMDALMSLSHVHQYTQVHTYWNWGNVRQADVYLGEFEEMRDRNASHTEYVTLLSTLLRLMMALDARHTFNEPFRGWASRRTRSPILMSLLLGPVLHFPACKPDSKASTVHLGDERIRSFTCASNVRSRSHGD